MTRKQIDRVLNDLRSISPCLTEQLEELIPRLEAECHAQGVRDCFEMARECEENEDRFLGYYGTAEDVLAALKAKAEKEGK